MIYKQTFLARFSLDQHVERIVAMPDFYQLIEINSILDTVSHYNDDIFLSAFINHRHIKNIWNQMSFNMILSPKKTNASHLFATFVINKDIYDSTRMLKALFSCKELMNLIVDDLAIVKDYSSILQLVQPKYLYQLMYILLNPLRFAASSDIRKCLLEEMLYKRSILLKEPLKGDQKEIKLYEAFIEQIISHKSSHFNPVIKSILNENCSGIKYWCGMSKVSIDLSDDNWLFSLIQTFELTDKDSIRKVYNEALDIRRERIEILADSTADRLSKDVVKFALVDYV
jgi:hypothetical protein